MIKNFKKIKGFFKTPQIEKVSQIDFLWMTSLFCQSQHIEVDFAQLQKKTKEEVYLSEFNLYLQDLNVTIDKKVSETSPLKFILINKKESDVHELAVLLKENKGQIEIVSKDGKKQELNLNDENYSFSKPFILKRKLNLFDFSEQEIKQNFGFKWFISEIFQYKSFWYSVLAASLLIQCLGFAMPLMTQTIVDKVIVNLAQQTLISMVIGVALLNIMNTVLSWARQKLIVIIGNKVDEVLAIMVVSKIFKLPLNYFYQRGTGNIISRMHGIESIKDFLTGSFLTIALDLPFALLFFGIMLYYSVILSGISLLFLITMLLMSVLVAPIIRKRYLLQAQLAGKNQAFLTEHIASMETVKSTQSEVVITERYRDNYKTFLNLSKEVRSAAINYNNFMTLLDQMCSLTILGVGAYICMQETGLTIGMLIAFQMFAQRVNQPILRIANVWQEFQQNQISINRLKDIVDQKEENYSLIENTITSNQADIKIKNLSFKYPNQPYLYQQMNVDIQSGELIIIQGESGCGKSTLSKLIQGFETQYEGTIEVCGVDIKKLSMPKLRSLVGYVPQETVLFSGSIMDNFKKAQPKANIEMIAHACKLAGIHDVIQSLPDGYQTELGERGAGLSGGQKQRIAIARALLKNPKILIFDESISSLDPESRNLIGETINNLKGKITMLFITHISLPNVTPHKTLMMKKNKS
jgi:ATP-binding cassette, subfamily B, bacterial HlyB/CyaB